MLNRSNAQAKPFRAIEDLESRRLMTSTYDIGINMNDGASATVPKVVPILKSLGVKTLRLWTSISDFNTHSMNGVLKRAVDYSNAGFDIDLIVQTGSGKMQSTTAVAGWFQWAMSQPSLKAAVDQWEIGNEPDHDEYWQGTLSQYVSNFLKPAYEVLHANGEEVISAGPSWNAQDVQKMIDAGMLDYCDYVGFHPYAKGVSGVVKSITAINDVVAGRKPIAATEWNVRGLESNKTAWAQAVQDVYPYIKAGFDLNYYFAMKVQDSMAGPAGILTSSLTPNQPFYNAFATFSGADPVDPSTGGNTPTSVTGKLTGTLWEDADADGVKDSTEAVTGSRVVYIDDNANGTLDSGEKSTTSDASGVYTFNSLTAGTYKVTRVFPAGYKLSNNSAGYVTATVTAGGTTSGVNLGTTKATTTPTTPTPTTGGITGTLFEDADADGTWDSTEVVTGSRVVFIDTNANGTLDSGEKSTTSDAKGVFSFTGLTAGSYKVSRVFPAGYKLSNNSLGYVTASVTAGKTTTGVNLGTTKTATTPVTPPTPPVSTTPAITMIRLIDTATNKVIATYSNITKSTTISIAALKTKNIAVEAVGNSYTKSTKLTALGKTIVENNAPYAFFTDNNGVFAAWSVTPGSYAFSATAYSATVRDRHEGQHA
ncbi:MAG: SdrD B-like domain-containing protein [Tepidisphaeraceae bacterium]